jgi:hypothetical protein
VIAWGRVGGVPRRGRIPETMLNDAVITNALNQTVEKIREGDLQQAQAGLVDLEFHRLMRPLKDSSKGPRQFFDPGREFGP